MKQMTAAVVASSAETYRLERHSMNVALVCDEPIPQTLPGILPNDIGAEYEDAATIAGLRQALEANRHRVTQVPFDGNFFARIDSIRPDIVFNIAEGILGPTRESIVPAWLEHLQIPYTGSNGLTLAITLDKTLAKEIVSNNGIYTPKWERISSVKQLESIDLEYPIFVKPNSEGSSMGIRHASKATTYVELKRQVAWVIGEYRQDCLLEEFAPGREFCVAILGNDEPEVLPIAEIQVAGDFYSYEEKSRHSKEMICPADLPDRINHALSTIGLAIFKAFRCRDLARIDFKMDAHNRPTFLEINPLPGLSRYHGTFPYQAAAAGIEYSDLIERIVQGASEREALSMDGRI